MKGEFEEAITLFEEVHRLTNHPLKGLAPLGYAYAKTAQEEKALQCIEKMEQRLAQEPESVPEVDLAEVWWALGNRDKAFHYLSLAVDKRMPIGFGFHSPLYDGMEDDPRMTELKQKMNLYE